MSESSSLTPGKSLESDLRLIREAKGLTREDIFNRVHIRPEVLTQVEEFGFAATPTLSSDIHRRSFVKHYADAIGLNAATALEALNQSLEGAYDGLLAREYLDVEQSAPPRVEPPEVRKPEPAPPADVSGDVPDAGDEPEETIGLADDEEVIRVKVVAKDAVIDDIPDVPITEGETEAIPWPLTEEEGAPEDSTGEETPEAESAVVGPNRARKKKAAAPEVTEPEAEVTEPEAEVTEPDAEVTEPDAEVAEPDAEVAEPEAEVTEPDAEVAEPEAEVTEPEAEALKSEAEVAEPEAEVTEPEVEALESEAEVVEHEAEIAEPEDEAEEAKAEAAEPEPESAVVGRKRRRKKKAEEPKAEAEEAEPVAGVEAGAVTSAEESRAGGEEESTADVEVESEVEAETTESAEDTSEPPTLEEDHLKKEKQDIAPVREAETETDVESEAEAPAEPPAARVPESPYAPPASSGAVRPATVPEKEAPAADSQPPSDQKTSRKRSRSRRRAPAAHQAERPEPGEVVKHPAERRDSWSHVRSSHWLTWLGLLGVLVVVVLFLVRSFTHWLSVDREPIRKTRSSVTVEGLPERFTGVVRLDDNTEQFVTLLIAVSDTLKPNEFEFKMWTHSAGSLYAMTGEGNLDPSGEQVTFPDPYGTGGVFVSEEGEVRMRSVRRIEFPRWEFTGQIQ